MDTMRDNWDWIMGNVHRAVEANAEVDVVNSCGATPISRVGYEGSLKVAQYLLRRRPSESASDRHGATALLGAAGVGHLDFVRYLVEECGINGNASDRSGNTALLKAAEGGHIDIVRYLDGLHHANVNTSDWFGITPLMKAAYAGHTEIVEILAECCGANVDGIDRWNSSKRIPRNSARAHPFVPAQQSEVSFTTSQNCSSSTVPRDAKQNWSITPSEIALINFVKVGNVGGEYCAKWLDADAVVKLFLPDASSHATFEDEVRLWHQLRHPNVIKMYGAYQMGILASGGTGFGISSRERDCPWRHSLQQYFDRRRWGGEANEFWSKSVN
ncbi:unnamed protein product [Phytophthora lilii]|uniref:Unnamed protein product n=1 Tax=Phytophthora lilii TaxID=2077276 RepID=A0A9W6TZS5_9STRA|nr:unnamed protein product [Phytophthora lilii]